MLGWEVLVFRRLDDAPGHKPDRALLARWQTSLGGLEWINELVEQNRAVSLGGNGYPCRYSVAAGVLLPVVTTGLPPHNSPPVFGNDYILPEGWSGDVELDHEAIAACPSDVQLLVEAWDLS
jgi:hypothetical protein